MTPSCKQKIKKNPHRHLRGTGHYGRKITTKLLIKANPSGTDRGRAAAAAKIREITSNGSRATRATPEEIKTP